MPLEAWSAAVSRGAAQADASLSGSDAADGSQCQGAGGVCRRGEEQPRSAAGQRGGSRTGESDWGAALFAADRDQAALLAAAADRCAELDAGAGSSADYRRHRWAGELR